jgi:hypothetical protein
VPDDVRRNAYLELVGCAASGDVNFPIETYPLERVAEAWRRQVEGPGAKLIVTI